MNDVLALRHALQISQPVVRLVAVDVVDDLHAGRNWPLFSASSDATRSANLANARMRQTDDNQQSPAALVWNEPHAQSTAHGPAQAAFFLTSAPQHGQLAGLPSTDSLIILPLRLHNTYRRPVVNELQNPLAVIAGVH